MTNGQDANSKAEAGESLKDVAENTISSTSDKDALGESSLDDVSGALGRTAPLKPQSSLRLSDLRVHSVTGLDIAEPLR